MRFAFFAALVLLVTTTPSALGGGLPPELRLNQDGVTAKITSPGSVADLLFQPDANGNFVVDVTIYQKVAGAWEPVSMYATLRVFTVDLVNGESDRVSKGFVSSDTGAVQLTFPANAVDDVNAFDVFITFSSLPPNPEGRVPTSHHGIVKNLLIDLGQFDLADRLDYHRVLPAFAL